MISESMEKMNPSSSLASEVCARFALKNEARPLLRDGMGSREFAQALVENKQYISGIEFVAHALPAREAVWWGCLCLQHVCGATLSAADKTACRAAVQWVMEPTEQNRSGAQAPAQQAGLASAAGQLALAASQAVSNAPAPAGSSKAVAAAVKLTSTKADPKIAAETQRLFVELGATWLKPASR